jgi:hypothetical protein
MPPLIPQMAMCLVSTILGIAAYDRIVVRPATAIGVVDAVQVYREKEAQLVKSLSAGAGEAERARAASEARHFAQQLPVEMARLADDCACLVVDRTVVVGMRPGVRNLTPMLRERVLR